MAVRRTSTAFANVSLMVGGGHVENEVLVAGLFECGNGVVQLGQIRAADAQNEARRLGDLVHGR